MTKLRRQRTLSGNLSKLEADNAERALVCVVDARDAITLRLESSPE